MEQLAEKRSLACEEIVAEGSPRRSIIRASDEIGALGSKGMTSLERALIGSESQKVLLYCECPILLVREP
jgi:nucleotide-binding universal stress UspA family protein